MSEKPKLENPFEGWASIDEAARIVGFNRTTVTYWADQGYITAYPVGQRMRVVNLEEIRNYAEERRHTRKLNKYTKRKR